MAVYVEPAERASKPVIAGMLQPYLRELAPYFGGSSDPDTIHEYPYLDAYWEEPGKRFPFLVMVDGEIAGFALVNEHSRLGALDTRSIAEFYVKPGFRRMGVGMSAAGQIFNCFVGKWEVAILEGNQPAEHFWKLAITNLGNVSYTEQRTGSWNGSILTFDVSSG